MTIQEFMALWLLFLFIAVLSYAGFIFWDWRGQAMIAGCVTILLYFFMMIITKRWRIDRWM